MSLLPTRPIKERIETFLTARPNVTHVPVHPEDYAEALGLYKTGAFGDNPPWELKILGKLRPRDEDEADEDEYDEAE